jgi:hypothetical protein
VGSTHATTGRSCSAWRDRANSVWNSACLLAGHRLSQPLQWPSQSSIAADATNSSTLSAVFACIPIHFSLYHPEDFSCWDCTARVMSIHKHLHTLLPASHSYSDITCSAVLRNRCSLTSRSPPGTAAAGTTWLG